ncbi:hypothetical protein M3Y99_01893600 [Aphelenchoides fujianensis]|nr:hypothetical protein M3Y99_01893600 [Aphelenchoides fujianensis]
MRAAPKSPDRPRTPRRRSRRPRDEASTPLDFSAESSEQLERAAEEAEEGPPPSKRPRRLATRTANRQPRISEHCAKTVACKRCPQCWIHLHGRNPTDHQNAHFEVEDKRFRCAVCGIYAEKSSGRKTHEKDQHGFIRHEADEKIKRVVRIRRAQLTQLFNVGTALVDVQSTANPLPASQADEYASKDDLQAIIHADPQGVYCPNPKKNDVHKPKRQELNAERQRDEEVRAETLVEGVRMIEADEPRAGVLPTRITHLEEETSQTVDRQKKGAELLAFIGMPLPAHLRADVLELPQAEHARLGRHENDFDAALLCRHQKTADKLNGLRELLGIALSSDEPESKRAQLELVRTGLAQLPIDDSAEIFPFRAEVEAAIGDTEREERARCLDEDVRCAAALEPSETRDPLAAEWLGDEVAHSEVQLKNSRTMETYELRADLLPVDATRMDEETETTAAHRREQTELSAHQETDGACPQRRKDLEDALPTADNWVAAFQQREKPPDLEEATAEVERARSLLAVEIAWLKEARVPADQREATLKLLQAEHARLERQEQDLTSLRPSRQHKMVDKLEGLRDLLEIALSRDEPESKREQLKLIRAGLAQLPIEEADRLRTEVQAAIEDAEREQRARRLDEEVSRAATLKPPDAHNRLAVARDQLVQLPPADAARSYPTALERLLAYESEEDDNSMANQTAPARVTCRRASDAKAVTTTVAADERTAPCRSSLPALITTRTPKGRQTSVNSSEVPEADESIEPVGEAPPKPKKKKWGKKEKEDLQTAFDLYCPLEDSDWRDLIACLPLDWTVEEVKAQAAVMKLQPKRPATQKKAAQSTQLVDRFKKIMADGKLPAKGTIRREQLEDAMAELLVQVDRNEDADDPCSEMEDRYLKEAIRAHALDKSLRVLPSPRNFTPSKRTFFPKIVSACRRSSSPEDFDDVGDDFSMPDRSKMVRYRQQHRAQQFNRRYGGNQRAYDPEREVFDYDEEEQEASSSDRIDEDDTANDSLEERFLTPRLNSRLPLPPPRPTPMDADADATLDRQMIDAMFD